MHRIQRLISPASPAPLAPRAGLLLLLLLGAGLGLQARHRFVASAPTPQSPRTPAQKMTVDLQKVELAQFLRMVADTAKVNLVIALDVHGTADFKFTDTPWDQILDAKLKPAGYDWELKNGILHVAKASALHERIKLTEALLKARTDTSTYSGHKITIDLKTVALGDLLRMLAKDGGIAITIDPKVQGTYSFKFTDTPWDQILDLVLMTANLDWEVRSGALHVTARPEAPTKK